MERLDLEMAVERVQCMADELAFQRGELRKRRRGLYLRVQDRGGEDTQPADGVLDEVPGLEIEPVGPVSYTPLTMPTIYSV